MTMGYLPPRLPVSCLSMAPRFDTKHNASIVARRNPLTELNAQSQAEVRIHNLYLCVFLYFIVQISHICVLFRFIFDCRSAKADPCLTADTWDPRYSFILVSLDLVNDPAETHFQVFRFDLLIPPKLLISFRRYPDPLCTLYKKKEVFIYLYWLLVFLAEPEGCPEGRVWPSWLLPDWPARAAEEAGGEPARTQGTSSGGRGRRP